MSGSDPTSSQMLIDGERRTANGERHFFGLQPTASSQQPEAA
jgi:hypothetical protein